MNINSLHVTSGQLCLVLRAKGHSWGGWCRQNFYFIIGTWFDRKRLSMQIRPWHAKAIPDFIWFPETLRLLLVGGKQASPACLAAGFFPSCVYAPVSQLSSPPAAQAHGLFHPFSCGLGALLWLMTLHQPRARASIPRESTCWASHSSVKECFMPSWQIVL